ncbi:hypothetical protein [Cohnella sp.]|uniref:hypothetical protein n=1 Tax=Cohnella sp. TaxID=1883426 RepID=UPI00356898FD
MNDAKLDLLLNKMEAMQLQQNSQGEHVRQLIHIVGSTHAKVEELTEDIQQIKQDLTVLKDDVSFLRQDVAVLSEDMSELKSDAHQLKSSQQTLLGIQKEQQKILERLSVRSLSQEADIAELKKF